MNIKPIGDTINERIANYRKRMGYTQKDIADVFNMKLSTYSQRERKGEITCDFAIKIAKFLDVDIRCLLFGDEKYSLNGFIDNEFTRVTKEQQKEKLTEVTPEGKTLYYLSGQEISIFKMISGFPKKYREKTLNYIGTIYHFLREEKIKRNNKF